MYDGAPFRKSTRSEYQSSIEQDCQEVSLKKEAFHQDPLSDLMSAYSFFQSDPVYT
jgi:hypothetical protein